MTTISPGTTAESPMVDVPDDALYWCSFELAEACNITIKPGNGGLTWEFHTGQTDSLGTGPDSALSGNYYVYTEASFHPEGSKTR